jgi:hypothetical protein
VNRCGIAGIGLAVDRIWVRRLAEQAVLLLDVREIASLQVPLQPSIILRYAPSASNMAPALLMFVLIAMITSFAMKTYLEWHWKACIFVPLAAVPTLYATYRTYIYSNFFSPLRHIPQPRGALPFIGHDLALFQQPPAQDFNRWMREVQNDGLVSIQHALKKLALSGPRLSLTHSCLSSRFVSADYLDLIACSSPIPKQLSKF